jgi:hypothetical protein
MPPLPFTDVRTIAADLLQPFDRWVLEGAPQVQWNSELKLKVNRAGVDDVDNDSSTGLKRAGDVLVALKVSGTNTGSKVEVRGRTTEPAIGCHLVGEWWVLDAPIVMLWTLYDHFTLLVDGEPAVGRESTSRFIYFDTDYRQAVAKAAAENTLHLPYPSCTLEYSKSELHVQPPEAAPAPQVV